MTKNFFKKISDAIERRRQRVKVTLCVRDRHKRLYRITLVGLPLQNSFVAMAGVYRFNVIRRIEGQDTLRYTKEMPLVHLTEMMDGFRNPIFGTLP